MVEPGAEQEQKWKKVLHHSRGAAAPVALDLLLHHSCGGSRVAAVAVLVTVLVAATVPITVVSYPTR